MKMGGSVSGKLNIVKPRILYLWKKGGTENCARSIVWGKKGRGNENSKWFIMTQDQGKGMRQKVARMVIGGEMMT